jgi:DNA-directed RNA polymerase alpha subunit
MAEIQMGGLYRVGDKLVDANGKEAEQTEKPVDASDQGAAGGDDLPSDFPGAGDLAKHGWTTYAHLAGKTREEYIAVKGVGEKTADEILTALKRREA